VDLFVALVFPPFEIACCVSPHPFVVFGCRPVIALTALWQRLSNSSNQRKAKEFRGKK
jgi:hypothetical protein